MVDQASLSLPTSLNCTACTQASCNRVRCSLVFRPRRLGPLVHLLSVAIGADDAPTAIALQHKDMRVVCEQ